MLTRPPIKESRNSSSITLSWLPWTRPPDLGDGPVSHYKVYYKPQWLNVDWMETASTGELCMVVGSLRPRVSYQFKVVPLHDQGFEGRPSTVATVSTCSGKCSFIQVTAPSTTQPSLCSQQHKSYMFVYYGD